MTTIEDYLKLHAEKTPGKTAIATPTGSVTYGRLWDTVEEKAAQLADMRGKAVAFRALPDVDTVATYFALHVAGAAAVPLDKALPDALMDEYRRSLAQDSPADGTADVLFTTGTTGRQKGVMISSDTILANAENLVEAQGFTSDVEFVINGPLNHIGSLSKIYPTIYVGGTMRIVDGMRDINAFFSAIEPTSGRHAATFLVPANIRMLLTFGRDKLSALADKIEFIETGAAPMAQSDMEALCATLPKTRLYNTYASTETGIISTFDYNAGECIAGCLGKPMRHSHIDISPDGFVSCSGRTLMTGYWGDPELTRRTLEDGVIKTSDVGSFDEKGRLRLSGRGDDVINIGGFKVSPSEVEDAAMRTDWVRDCICVEAEHKILGKTLKLIVETDGRELDPRALAAAMSERLEAHKVPTSFERTDKIKRTFNGKLDRKAYRAGSPS